MASLPVTCWLLSLSVALLGLGACGWLPQAEAPAECGFPDGAALAYAGETSLAALGLESGASSDHDIARIYVTQDPVPFTGSLPMTPTGPAVVPDQRRYCAISAESTTLGGVPRGWTPRWSR